MKVLILSSSEDVHALSVETFLRDLDVEVDIFRYDDFLRNYSLNYSIGGGQTRYILEKDAGGTLNLHDYHGIWHRRPGQVVAGKFPEPWIASMVEHEGRNALEGMLYSLGCLWMNYPPNDFLCMVKLLQLERASSLGLVIPETIVTNKPELVRDFYKHCHGEVIYKLLGEGTNFSIPAFENPRGISTLPLRESDLEHLSQVVHAPHLFQRKMSKSYELRVTIVGHKIFAIKIDSQSGEGKLDWRNDYSVEMVPYDLPPGLGEKCLNLMRNFGLNYGALDFIVTADGDYIFLEINCAGQYKWIEMKTDLKISEEIARLLSGKAPPLTPRRG